MRFRAFVLLIALLAVFTPAHALHPNPETHTPVPAVQATSASTAPFACGYSQEIANLLNSTSADHWMGWVRRLSGAEAVTLNGKMVALDNRHSELLFNGQSAAYTYLLDQVKNWYPTAYVEDPYEVTFRNQPQTWKNLILTIPGRTQPEEIVVLTAHFDSTNGAAHNPPADLAPGADDNASGAAALLEAARILRQHPLPRTIRLIWFTGEEQGRLGSQAYALDHDLSGIVGVINLDMFGYDSNQDRCFEIHAGLLPESNAVGQCVVNTIEAYDLSLAYDYLTYGATSASDHATFWYLGIGAVEIGENFFYNELPGGCAGSDINPYYHKATDTAEHINESTGFDIVQAALGAAFSMALEPASVYLPQLLMN